MKIDLITIEKFCHETGYSDSAIRGKISSGSWQEGKEYFRTPDKKILISVTGFYAWAIQNTKESGKQATPQSRSISTIAAQAAASGYSSSPPPLT